MEYFPYFLYIVALGVFFFLLWRAYARMAKDIADIERGYRELSTKLEKDYMGFSNALLTRSENLSERYISSSRECMERISRIESRLGLEAWGEPDEAGCNACPPRE